MKVESPEGSHEQAGRLSRRPVAPKSNEGGSFGAKTDGLAIRELDRWLRRLMDQDTFTKITVVLHQLHGSASAAASFVLAPLMLAGVVFGCLLTRWIFSGGLSRSVFRVRD